jgi:hypothetical protein
LPDQDERGVRMSNKDNKKEHLLKDVEIPSPDSEIESWCKASEEHSSIKTGDDILIDAWCHGSQNSDKNNEKRKK